MEYVVISLLVVTVALLFFLVRRQKPATQGDAAQLLLLQQQLDGLRTEMSKTLQNSTESVARNLKDTADTLFQGLRDTTTNLNDQLSRVTHQLQDQTSSVGSRLDNAAKVIGDVQKNLGELGQATQEIKELGQSVSKLEEMLRAPKLRGGLGELLLEELLRQVIASEYVEMQYRFKNGQIVDAVVKISGGMVPIDSKFPLENFRKMIDVQSETEKKAFQKAFISDVKRHIDAIAEKYIVPDEGTFDFALMYIPAENVYYETIIKDETSDASNLYSYALKKSVVPVSPNTFYAYLRVIVLGLRGLQIEKSAKAILNNLSRLQGEIAKVRETYDVLGTHLDNARKKYEEADKRLSQFEQRVENISEQSLGEGESPKLLS